MATKSILKTIHIKQKKTALRLVQALENAKGKGEKDVIMTRGYSEASRDEIGKMFGGQNDGV